MIATGNHLRFTIRCALQHAPGRVPCKKSEMFDYPSGFLPRQKATSPDKGRHGCGANPGDIGRCGGRGNIASGRLIAAPTLTRHCMNTPLRGNIASGRLIAAPTLTRPCEGDLGGVWREEGENFLFLFLSLRQKSKIFASLIRGRLSAAVGRGKAKKKALRVSAAPCM